MKTAGVPDSVAFSRLSRAVAELKSQADVARTEMVTQQYEDMTKAANGDIGGLHLLKKAIDDAQAYQRSMALAENRTSRSQAVLGSLTEEATRLGAGSLAAIESGNESGMHAVSADARGTLFTIFSSLNTTAGGRSLFAGDATDTPPLGDVEALLNDVQAIIAGAADAAAAEAALDTYFDDPAGGFATTIYQGGAGEAPAVELAPGIRVNGAVKANAQPIKDLIRGLAVLANYAEAPSGSQEERDKLAQAAAERTLSAEARITDLRAIVGVAEARFAERKNQYENEEAALLAIYHSKTVRDPYEAASQLKELEAQLDASYLLTARLSNLSLANYLR